MKQFGSNITGDPVRLESYTSDWSTIRLHPAIFYRRQDEIDEGLEDIKGLYAQIDMGNYVMLRFSEKDDLTEFHRKHYQYL